jgi:hypothetical protein
MNQELKALATKSGDTLLAIASSDDKDRMGDVIKATGWNLKNFLKNPVIQFAHKYDDPPVGIAKNIRVEGNQLLFEPMFHEITQLSREIKAMFFADPPIMRAFSVGFIPTKFNKDNPHIIEESELLEISAVPVPANQEALLISAKSYNADEEKNVMCWINKMAEIKSVEESKPEEVKPVEVPKVEEPKVEDKPKDKVELAVGDECVTETDEDGNIEDDGNGNMVCMPKKSVEQKSGRVLSEKNIGVVEDAVASMKLAVAVLRDLLDSVKVSTEKATEGKLLKGRKEEVHKSLKNRITVRALQKIDKQINEILRYEKRI